VGTRAHIQSGSDSDLEAEPESYQGSQESVIDATSQSESDEDSDYIYEEGGYLDEYRLRNGVNVMEDNAAMSRSAEDGHSLGALLFRGGKLTRGSVLDMLTEAAAFHHASRHFMRTIVDIINLVALDGGAPEPILSSWDAHDKQMRRCTQLIAKKYFVCPYTCTTGCWPWTGQPPSRCTDCCQAITLQPHEIKQYMLRHFDLEASLAAILSHPGLFLSHYISLSLSQLPSCSCFSKRNSNISLHFAINNFFCIYFAINNLFCVCQNILIIANLFCDLQLICVCQKILIIANYF